MSKPPAFQFYVGDWVLSTRTLSAEARGIYIDLLAFAWDNDGLPDDLTDLHQFCGISKRRFDKLWLSLEARWVPNGNGRLINQRQETEREKQRVWRAKSAKGGRASARAKRHHP